MQCMLERMESMAGRIIAKEVMAVTETDGYGALDEVGKERWRKICQELHQTCTKVNREQKIENHHWRVEQSTLGKLMAANRPSQTSRMRIRGLVLRTPQLQRVKRTPKERRNFACRHQRKRALGGSQTSGASLGPLTFLMAIACGTSSDRSPYFPRYQNGLTCYGVEKKLNTT